MRGRPAPERTCTRESLTKFGIARHRKTDSFPVELLRQRPDQVTRSPARSKFADRLAKIRSVGCLNVTCRPVRMHPDGGLRHAPQSHHDRIRRPVRVHACTQVQLNQAAIAQITALPPHVVIAHSGDAGVSVMSIFAAPGRSRWSSTEAIAAAFMAESSDAPKRSPRTVPVWPTLIPSAPKSSILSSNNAW